MIQCDYCVEEFDDDVIFQIIENGEEKNICDNCQVEA